MDFVEHAGLLGAQIGGWEEVTRDPVTQARGFADIEDDALAVLHEIDAGDGWQVAGGLVEPSQTLVAGFGAPGRRCVGGEEPLLVEVAWCVWGRVIWHWGVYARRR